MEQLPVSGKEELNKNAQIQFNNINRIILNILCAEGLRKIKFILHVLRELLQKKKNILHVYITNDIDHLSTEKSRKEIFNTLQEEIELCENESDYHVVKKKIEEYINALSETNEILCQNSPTDRNLKDNRNKIIEDGSLLLNIFLNMKRLNFASVVKELDAFKEEQNLLLNLRQNVYHKKQIVHILKDQIKEQIETTDKKKKVIQEKIQNTERRKKIFFVKSMLYYMYKKEYVQANASSYEMKMNFKHHSTKECKDMMERDLKSYANINDYIKAFLNKRNDNLQNVHDELVEYYKKERRKRMQRLEQIKNEFKESLRAIQLKREQIEKYEQVNKQREEEEKEKMRKEIDEREHLKEHNQYVLFLQDIARSKIKDYEEKKRRRLRKSALKKKKK
ncbi:conserved Plasmodium protein, unknown function [Plasmodium knowlesi strain H]|uniref:Uncharacterized protein n=3 Tax=Plasmodium knowlesi TaxID=5850 RepID=A0A5K1UX19_PLAKH|nr:conserved Plasmodium protein, unknown function [Plasmodium knowlesi strain H]OTN64923.1 Uncharacterized protein PKNOH_S120148000 [Plasmodium knowlesi]CAA9988337.1 conserved Plasmodium protein, unknown function [Plasmodium knowlesi strain H]SBO20122.1 conserved Plasmodium protein, unknown function [Plasmodium knowlesi strain H]SBO20289.1 conserved Plasmodium protein, unknown function [Plasmodium knowlesi strain H]VVS77811.1 conserved Plasmodium protein, unknown function [Plasmodium knowlesi |eukprot:XP_002259316.1 hypothetical protein, conserved in Plasmodium species [Plasmodium knowlesi strain H]